MFIAAQTAIARKRDGILMLSPENRYEIEGKQLSRGQREARHLN
jgi:hypothetical protein